MNVTLARRRASQAEAKRDRRAQRQIKELRNGRRHWHGENGNWWRAPHIAEKRDAK